MSVLDKVRRWIDGETSELVLEEAARNAQVKPRSQAEEFIVKIARAVEEVMQQELVPLPQGTTIIPTEYIIFLSEEDDKDWQGVKRRGLEQGLYHILAERAKEIAGKRKLETKSFVVELRVDGTLETGEVRVQHSWDEGSSNKTGVLARPKPAPKTPSKPIQHQNYPQLETPDFLNTQSPFSNSIQPQPVQKQGVPVGNPFQTDEDLTHVNERKKELFRLEIWRGGVRQNVVPIFQNEITIGRGSKSKPVDISLGGDPEISRRHLVLILDNTSQFWIINEGRNPGMINNTELPIGRRISIAPGTPINICSYLIRIQT